MQEILALTLCVVCCRWHWCRRRSGADHGSGGWGAGTVEEESAACGVRIGVGGEDSEGVEEG